MAYITVAEKESFGREMLEDLVGWIEDNLEIDQVFSDEEIFNWLTEVADQDLWDRIKLWIMETEQPEDVFGTTELERWADQHHAYGQE